MDENGPCMGTLNRRQFLLGLACMSLAQSARSRTMKPWVVAHRGGAKLAPENTLRAFEGAIALGADAFELDIHLTRDRQLVVIHDDTLKRTSKKEGIVRQMSLAQLKETDSSIPSLVEALRLARGKCRVIVEIKHPHGSRHEGIEEILLKTLEQEKMLNQVVVISFDRQSLKTLRQLSPTLETGYLFGSPTPLQALKKDLGITFVGPHYRLANAEFIAEAHVLDLKVNAWTVDEPDDMRRLLQDCCDCITTDRPDRLLQLLATP